jgi:hypothetical protein
MRRKRHFTRLQTLCWLSRIDVGGNLIQSEEENSRPPKSVSFHRVARKWLTVIASDFEGIVSFQETLKLDASYAFVINERNHLGLQPLHISRLLLKRGKPGVHGQIVTDIQNALGRARHRCRQWMESMGRTRRRKLFFFKFQQVPVSLTGEGFNEAKRMHGTLAERFGRPNCGPRLRECARTHKATASINCSGVQSP